jgi:antitoxin (DNA-binding transcriptional repressor) of toxin-antitoxin stability system
MKVTARRLRSELYRILDRVLATGESVEVACAAGTVVIKPLRLQKRARKPKPNHDLVVGNPDDLVHFDWTPHWNVLQDPV